MTDLSEAIRRRRSAARVTGPAPTDDDVLDLVAAAATGPDHGLMRPWRLISVRGAARSTLGRAAAADLPPEDEAGRDREAAKPLRAPLLLSIVFTPRENPKVPEWEQLAATSAMVHNLVLLLHVRGWGAMWRTGPASRSSAVGAVLGLAPGERSLGWLFVGTPDPVSIPAPRPAFDARDRLSQLTPQGAVTPLFPRAGTAT
ncbi:nitroreductase family protein [Actinokineospora iranica]|uniref:Putative NAD(P)H nitroreductase n=1 Tax=Actinokineospora iranica TaxID=1271860 RepID=A0A1G6QX42_9PSEU|nr:nitroreductase [Actinokineospora iranica]SDC96930.1 Nitroreductase [Actinokineospora iranica]